MTTKVRAATKKKVKHNIIDAIAHISASFNNTIVTIADKSGKVLAWSSAGTCGFKGSRKSTHLRHRWQLKKLAILLKNLE